MSTIMPQAISQTLGCVLYPRSVFELDNGTLFMVQRAKADFLVAAGPAAEPYAGERFTHEGLPCVIAPLTAETADVLRGQAPFTAPSPVLRKACTIGLGDRLGIATPGHIQALASYDVYPVFAQQSIRELTLTGRCWADVLNSATFAVFREGYGRPWGFDGDHLKTEAEVQSALDAGCTMITLDLSGHIGSGHQDICELPAGLRQRYLDKVFDLPNGIRIAFDENSLQCCLSVYGAALDFAETIYNRFLRDKTDRVDFELSIDETETPTSPEQHYFVAQELSLRGIIPVTVAPRFCGEFQKGIDYIGDIAQFEAELAVHAAIAMHFGYKLSIHSGSDKFSVFPAIGRHTGGNFHVKTAGTNWLEAMRVVAEVDPALYREAHKFALSRFADAKRYYHVTTDLTRIPDIDSLADDALPGLFENDAARQLIHITYGFLLSEQDAENKPLFRDRLYALWQKESDRYARHLATHIGRHLALLGL